MNIAIVDDAESDLRCLEQMISAFLLENHIEHRLSTFRSGEEFLAAFLPGQFDAVFLDNLMEGMSGMETARRLRNYDSRIPIIFVTTEKSYALEGYTVQAMDYIIKPVSQERLESTMERLSDRFFSQRFIEIRESRMERRLLLNDIQYVRSTGHFLEIHTVSEIIRPYMSLDYFLGLLEEMGEYGIQGKVCRFQNCCRGYVVNFDYVSSLGSRDFILTSGGIVPVSRPKYKEMQTAYASYLFAKTRNGG